MAASHHFEIPFVAGVRTGTPYELPSRRSKRNQALSYAASPTLKPHRPSFVVDWTIECASAS
eukprot:985440-Amphidinium_carterae.1